MGIRRKLLAVAAAVRRGAGDRGGGRAGVGGGRGPVRGVLMWRLGARAGSGCRVGAVDPDAPGTAIQVHVYVDGVGAGSTLANKSRPDAGYGGFHGYDDVVAYLTAGSHTVCTYGINTAGPGTNALLGCVVFNVDNQLFGTLDTVTQVPGGVQFAGWVIDPDVAGAINVDAWVGSTKVTAPANVSRADVGAAYPLWGPNHGFVVTVPFTAAGAQQVCLWGYNAGPGSNAMVANSCQTFTVNANPAGGLVGAPTKEYGGGPCRRVGPSIRSIAGPIDVQVRRYTTSTAYTTIWTGSANAGRAGGAGSVSRRGEPTTGST